MKMLQFGLPLMLLPMTLTWSLLCCKHPAITWVQLVLSLSSGVSSWSIQEQEFTTGIEILPRYFCMQCPTSSLSTLWLLKWYSGILPAWPVMIPDQSLQGQRWEQWGMLLPHCSVYRPNPQLQVCLVLQPIFSSMSSQWIHKPGT